VRSKIIWLTRNGRDRDILPGRLKSVGHCAPLRETTNGSRYDFEVLRAFSAFVLLLSATIGHTLFNVPVSDVGEEPAVGYTSYQTKSPAGDKIINGQRMVGLGLEFFINNRLEKDPGDR
jgi:hypothetical protein